MLLVIQIITIETHLKRIDSEEFCLVDITCDIDDVPVFSQGELTEHCTSDHPSSTQQNNNHFSSSNKV